MFEIVSDSIYKMIYLTVRRALVHNATNDGVIGTHDNDRSTTLRKKKKYAEMNEDVLWHFDGA